jgi:peptide/nickel transport system substrate-binding protein
MANWTVEELVEELKAGRISRRQFIHTLLGAGISMPLIVSILQACAPAPATPAQPEAPKEEFQPTRRGGGGLLKLLWWQAPVILNAHLSTGTKDFDGSRIFTEPLAAYDPDGEVFPILAAEVPSVEKGTLDREGRWVIWRLKKGVVWHDGQPFTADDVVFTWEYVMDPATAATTRGNYTNIKVVEKVDDYTVKITFEEPTPIWHAPFVGGSGHIFPKHLIAPYKGQNARNSPYNLKPVGTGPYKLVEFRPGDIIIAEINDKYHVPNRPFFDRLELKGGGDAPSAARAVLQTGEYDFAWNMQVEWDVLASLEKMGIGRVINYPGASTEHIQLNYTDPWTEVDGERSSIKTRHPFFSDPAVRKAFSYAVNRKLIVDELYGAGGQVGIYMVFNPKKYVPEGGRWEFNLEKAARMLDEAGWRRGPDGVRQKDGRRMKVLFQTSVNPVRQKTQAIIKKDLESIGVEVELKAVVSDVFFSSDPGNPDTYSHFYADMQMYTTGPSAPDPQAFLEKWTSWQVAQKANNWSGRNIERYQNPEYDRLWNQARTEMDPVKRAELIKRMNQMVIDDVVVIPIVNRNGQAAAKNNLRGMDLTTWDSNLWKLAYWYRTG